MQSKKFFKITNTVLIGKSFKIKGGQNPLEAARYGSRILHGPNTDNFKDIYKLLKSFKISSGFSMFVPPQPFPGSAT